MRNAYEVLREKEAQLVQLQKEIEALKIVAPILHADDFQKVKDQAVAEATRLLKEQVRPVVAQSAAVVAPPPPPKLNGNTTTTAKPNSIEVAASRWP